MRITAVDAFALRVPSPVAQTYWGSQAWVAGTGPGGARSVGVSDADAPGGVWEQYPPRWRMRATYSATINTVIVRITTDTGLVGYGEAKAPVAPEATREIVRDLLTPIVLGADPLDVDVLWERMYSTMRLRAHLSGFLLEAISGIDLALWDLAGKILNVPVVKLLGGAYRRHVKVYASGLPGLKAGHDETARERLRDQARALVARGFRAIKMGIGFGLDADVATVRTVREAVGDDVLLLCDAAGNYDVAQAEQVGRALESLDVGWLEAPIPPEHVDGHARLSQSLTLPVATDLLSTRYQVREFLVRGALDVVLPDVCRAGGLSECRRIAHLADVFGAGFAPHVSIGSAIQFAASAHLSAAIPNFVIMEYWIGDNPLGDAILKAPLRVDDGLLEVPMGPGFGLEIQEEALLRHAV
ncbi:MAG: mandelate racemase/muconate lactonizing enzyme family protein [Armatimonadota bacterium]|nr:mandelate racemase/muconate lactonizing enzyme family protein [Armatimonadota bacterium]